MEWFEKSFGDDYLEVYAHRNEAGAVKEAEQLARWLALPPDTAVIDYCCGNGRHAVALAGMGYQVTGMDLSESLLAVARMRKLDNRFKPVTWVRGDSRQAPFETGTFDGMVNVFTSFGYLESDGENEAILTEMARVLRPGGRLVMDFLNETVVRNGLVAESRRETETLNIFEKRRIENGYVKKEIRITERMHPDVPPRVYFERVRLFDRQTMEMMLQRNGLQVQCVYGDFDGSVFEVEKSPRLILICEKAGSRR